MTSLSTVSAGAQPPTTMIDDRICVFDTTTSDIQLERRTGCVLYQYTNTGVTEDIFNVTGSGILMMGGFRNNAAGATSSVITLIIDGTTVCTSTGGDVRSNALIVVGAAAQQTEHSGLVYEAIPFNTSAQLTVNSDATGQGFYNYYLT